jgi:hypothetical protein
MEFLRKVATVMRQNYDAVNERLDSSSTTNKLNIVSQEGRESAVFVRAYLSENMRKVNIYIVLLDGAPPATQLGEQVQDMVARYDRITSFVHSAIQPRRPKEELVSASKMTRVDLDMAIIAVRKRYEEISLILDAAINEGSDLKVELPSVPTHTTIQETRLSSPTPPSSLLAPPATKQAAHMLPTRKKAPASGQLAAS